MKVKDFFSLVKFSHTIFALPFAAIGFSLAIWYDGYAFDWYLLPYVLLCMIFACSAAMGFNRIVDSKFDAKNERTAPREIPAGVISKRAALVFVILMSMLFVATTWFINRICFYLSPVALGVILFYSYTKRFTPLCHLVLGIGQSLVPIGAYLALHGMPYFIAPKRQKHVASVMWFGNNKKENIEKEYSQDNLFHTLLGFFDVKTSVYKEDMDILNDYKKH